MKWPIRKIGSIKADSRHSLVGGPFGSDLTTRDYVPEGVPVIRGGNLPDDRSFLDEEFVYVTDEKADQLAANNAHADDVVFTQRGTLGQVGLIPSESRCARYLISQSQMKLTVNRKIADPRFIYYFFRHPETVQKIKNRAITSGVPHINLGILRDFDVPMPTVGIQQRIAATLAAYDDMIENNRRRMALLERSARQLYLEWFVRLRFPDHEQSRKIKGVPEGWAKTELMSLVDIKHGYAFQGVHFSDAETSRVLMTPGSFEVGGGFKVDKLKFYHEEAPLDLKYVLAPMDLVVTMTDLSKQSDTLGFPALVPRIGGLMFLHNQRIGKLVPITAFFPKYYLYCVLCDFPYRHHVVGAATGTSVKHTSPTRILAHSPLMPRSTELVSEFDKMSEPLFLQINCLRESNQQLRAARDLLLPRLMSGEVAV